MSLYPLKKVSLKNEEIAYRSSFKANNGQILILIHGNMSSSKHLEILMKELEEDYNMVAFDLRGMGASSYHNGFDSLHELADDMAQAMEKLAIKNAHVLGWSTGGGVAMSLSARYKGLVKSLILLSSVGPSGYPIYKKDEKFQPIFTERLKTKEEIENDPVQVLPVLNALKNKDKTFYKNLWNQLIYVCDKKPEDTLYEEYLDDMLTQRNLVDIDFALNAFNMTSRFNGHVEGDKGIEKIDVKTLVLRGNQDLVVPKSMAEEICEHLPLQAKYHGINNCGHNPLIDARQEVVTLIKEHINAVSNV